MYNIQFHKQAADFFKRLDKNLQQRIGKKINELKDNPELGKPLVGNFSGLWSLRIGDYRALYQIKNNELLILILKLGRRSNIYD